MKPSALHANVPSAFSVHTSLPAAVVVSSAPPLAALNAFSIIVLTPVVVIVPPEIKSTSSADLIPIKLEASSNQSSPIPSPLFPPSSIEVIAPSLISIVAVSDSPGNPSAEQV